MKYQKGIACSLAALLLAVLLPFTAAAAIIGKGNTGTAVEAVQVVLKQEGYLSGACDGIFGSATETALKAYQKTKGLSQDGKAGAKTLAAMGLLSEASSIGEASITEGTVNLRRGPSTSHQVLCDLKRGDKLTVLAVSGSWYQVRTSFDIEGYVYKAYCTANGNLQDPPASAVAATVVNVNTAVNLRKGAGTNTALLGTVAKNAQVWVLGGLHKQTIFARYRSNSQRNGYRSQCQYSSEHAQGCRNRHGSDRTAEKREHCECSWSQRQLV